MVENSRAFYKSSNGDAWTLVKIGERVCVRHSANVPSGGAITDAEVADFLKAGGMGAEKQALLDLIGTLVIPSDDSDRDDVTRTSA